MVSSFLTFDKLIGTKLIKVLYYVGMVFILISGLTTLLAAFKAGFMAVLIAPVVTLVGLVFWRFLCEIYLLFFRMSDDLRDIKNHQLGREANTVDVNVDL